MTEDESVRISGVKVFSATMKQSRDALGDRVAKWLEDHPQVTVVDKSIAQSSDSAFHCLSIILFFVETPLT